MHPVKSDQSKFWMKYILTLWSWGLRYKAQYHIEWQVQQLEIHFLFLAYFFPVTTTLHHIHFVLIWIISKYKSM